MLTPYSVIILCIVVYKMYLFAIAPLSEKSFLNNWELKKSNFLEFTKNLITSHRLLEWKIFNMDKVPVFFDIPPIQTVDNISTKSRIINTLDIKWNSFMVILTCVVYGNKLPVMIIVKHKTRCAENIFTPNIYANLYDNSPKILWNLKGLHKFCIVVDIILFFFRNFPTLSICGSVSLYDTYYSKSKINIAKVTMWIFFAHSELFFLLGNYVIQCWNLNQLYVFLRNFHRWLKFICIIDCLIGHILPPPPWTKLYQNKICWAVYKSK